MECSRRTRLTRPLSPLSYTDNTVQRYYQLNTSMPDVVTNVGSGGEYCKQYQIVAVPGTNVFVGVVNQTCDNPAFCACSRVSGSVWPSNSPPPLCQGSGILQILMER